MNSNNNLYSEINNFELLYCDIWYNENIEFDIRIRSVSLSHAEFLQS